MHSLINGTDVLVSTPSSATRIFRKHSSLFDKIAHIVLDDVNLLYHMFPDELQNILNDNGIFSLKPQIVALCSYWSLEVEDLYHRLSDPACIFGCAIEAVIRYKISVNTLPSVQSKLECLIPEMSTRETVVICTATNEDADYVYQVLRVNYWSPILLSDVTCGDDSAAKLIVASDSVLSVNPADIYCLHVMHYSPPSSKAIFRRRLSFLYKAMLQGLKCQCTILFCDTWKKQAVLLLDMKDRLNLPIHSDEKLIAAEQACILEDGKRNFDYCYQIKAWGICRKQKCKSLHKFSVKSIKTAPPTPALPSDGRVKVRVVHVSNATRLWVSLLDHIPATKGSVPVTLHNPFHFKKLCLDLAQYYSTKENRKYHVPGSLYEGCFCSYQSDEGSFFRVRVLKFSQPLGLYFSHREEARVRLIDVGCSKVVDINQLLYLPQEFVQVPTQVVEVYLSGIVPKDGDIDWPDEALRCSVNHLEGKVVWGLVGLSSEQTVWLKALEYRKVLTDIKIATGIFCPTQELLQRNLAEVNEGHLENVREKITQKDVKNISVEYLTLEKNCTMEVYISCVESPSFFHVHAVDCILKLDEMEDLLNCSLHTCNDDVVIGVGDMCCARFSCDERWYRCEVLSCREDSFEVFYVDYGNVEWVIKSYVMPLHESLLHFPPQVIECSLSEKVDFTGAGDILWDLTRGVPLTMKVTEMCSSKMSGMRSHSVVLCHEVSGESVIDMIQKEDLKEKSLRLSEQNVASPVRKVELVQKSDIHSHIQELLHALLTSPQFAAEFVEVSSLCQLIPLCVDSPSTLVHLLRLISGLLVFNERLELNMLDVDTVVTCLLSADVAVLELALILLKASFPRSRDSLHRKEVLDVMCSAVEKWKENAVIISHFLDLLHVLWTNGQLGADELCTGFDILFDANLSLSYSSAAATVGIFNQYVKNDNCRNFPFHLLESVFDFAEDVLVALCIMDTVEILCHHITAQRFPPLHVKCPILEFLWSLMVNVGSSKVLKCTFPSLKEKAVSHPCIYWSQEEFTVVLAVQVNGCHDNQVSVNVNGLSIQFRAVTEQGVYAFELDLFSSVSNKVLVKVLMSEILVKLMKVNPSEWPRLTVSRKRNIFVSYVITDIKGKCPLLQHCSASCANFQVEEEEGRSSDSDEDEEQDLEIGDCHFLSD